MSLNGEKTRNPDYEIYSRKSYYRGKSVILCPAPECSYLKQKSLDGDSKTVCEVDGDPPSPLTIHKRIRKKCLEELRVKPLPNQI